MSTAQHANHSGFARFTDVNGRDQFVRTVLDSDPVLKGRAYVAATRPTIVFENLSTKEREKVIAALHGLGHWFDDVQFQTTG